MTERSGWTSEPVRPAAPDAIPLTAGLCARCIHARRIVSDRGSAFVLCGAAATDPRLARYPRLPRWECHGYEPSGPREAHPDAG